MAGILKIEDIWNRDMYIGRKLCEHGGVHL